MRVFSNPMVCLTCLLVIDLVYCRVKHKNGKREKDELHIGKKIHRLLELSEKASKRLANLNDYTRFYTTLLKRMLRVRVPGTVGHHEVKKFIIKKLEDLNWEVKIDEFDSQTPFGVKRFTNIVATLDPRAQRRIAIAAHYDSKFMVPEQGKYFIGATDSAVPCAIMLDLAETLHSRLMRRTKATDVTLQLLFFDGEEAFVEWTDKDSLYGARHLAEVMSHRSHIRKGGPANSTMLSALDGLILLDLIGAKNPQFFDNYQETSAIYQRLQRIEKRLAVAGQLERYDAFQPYFVGKPPYGPLLVEDDHIPFLRKGVPILHLISIPFPDVWHKLTDDESALDQPTIENLLKIFRVFVAEYLHLN